MREISVEQTIITLLLGYACFRIFMDIVYLDDKPITLLVPFIAFSLIIVFFNMGSLINKTDITLIIFSLLMISYPLIFSQEVMIKQFLYDFKVLLVPLVLLSCSQLDISFDKLRKQAEIVIPIVLTITLFLFFSQYSTNIYELFKIFDNFPIHPVSQTVAKISFLFIYNKSIILALIIGVLVVLNVRSNLFPILMILLVIKIKKYSKYIFILTLFFIGFLLLMSAIDSDLISVESIFSRFITKNRESADAGGFTENFSSGRTEIWRYYINYIAENFTVLNYIFGTGSLELQGKYRINAHNDVLNIIVNFGFLGLILLVFIYHEIYKRLHPKYRKYIAFYFLFVFFANGVMFHQSNLLFLLYLQGNKDTYN